MTDLREKLVEAAKYCRDVPERGIIMETFLLVEGLLVEVRSPQGRATRIVCWDKIERNELLPILHTMHNGAR